MGVSVVELAADAYLTCLSHALTTEKEEVMGFTSGRGKFVIRQRVAYVVTYR